MFFFLPNKSKKGKETQLFFLLFFLLLSPSSSFFPLLSFLRDTGRLSEKVRDREIVINRKGNRERSRLRERETWRERNIERDRREREREPDPRWAVFGGARAPDGPKPDFRRTEARLSVDRWPVEPGVISGSSGRKSDDSQWRFSGEPGVQFFGGLSLALNRNSLGNL
jgi:hypothetical protein